MELLHGLCAARGERLPLGGRLVRVYGVVRSCDGCGGGSSSRSIAAVRGTGMRVHFGHLVAVHDWRGGHEHVRVGYGSGHGPVAVETGTLDGHHLIRGQQWVL